MSSTLCSLHKTIPPEIVTILSLSYIFKYLIIFRVLPELCAPHHLFSMFLTSYFTVQYQHSIPFTINATRRYAPLTRTLSMLTPLSSNFRTAGQYSRLLKWQNYSLCMLSNRAVISLIELSGTFTASVRPQVPRAKEKRPI